MAIAIDGLPARDSGPWAREKLFYVERYQEIFATGMKNKWPRRAYIDLLAGPGRCRDVEGEFDGSPILSMTADFTDRCFVEAEPTLAGALAQRLGTADQLIIGDANDAAVVDTIRQRIPPFALGLAFVDNLGLDIDFSTLRSLTRDRKIDLLITVMVGDLTRNLSHALADRDGHGTRFDSFFGSTSWRDVAASERQSNRSAGDIVNVLVDYYAKQFQAIGYQHFAGAKAPMKNSKQVDLYRLVLVARDAKAVEFFRKIETIQYSGQRGLF